MENFLNLDAFQLLHTQNDTRHNDFLLSAKQIETAHPIIVGRILPQYIQQVGACKYLEDQINYSKIFQYFNNSCKSTTSHIDDHHLKVMKAMYPISNGDEQVTKESEHMTTWLLRQSFSFVFATSTREKIWANILKSPKIEALMTKDEKYNSSLWRLFVTIHLCDPLIQIGTDWGGQCAFNDSCHASLDENIQAGDNVIVLVPAVYLAGVNDEPQKTVCKAIVMKVLPNNPNPKPAPK